MEDSWPPHRSRRRARVAGRAGLRARHRRRPLAPRRGRTHRRSDRPRPRPAVRATAQSGRSGRSRLRSGSGASGAPRLLRTHLGVANGRVDEVVSRIRRTGGRDRVAVRQTPAATRATRGCTGRRARRRQRDRADRRTGRHARRVGVAPYSAQDRRLHVQRLLPGRPASPARSAQRPCELPSRAGKCSGVPSPVERTGRRDDAVVTARAVRRRRCVRHGDRRRTDVCRPRAGARGIPALRRRRGHRPDGPCPEAVGRHGCSPALPPGSGPRRALDLGHYPSGKRARVTGPTGQSGTARADFRPRCMSSRVRSETEIPGNPLEP